MRAEVFEGFWDNIGTIEQLQALRRNTEALKWACF